MEWVSLGAQGGGGRLKSSSPEPGWRGGAGLNRECPDGEGVASAGEELTLYERLTPGTVGWAVENGMSALEVYGPSFGRVRLPLIRF